MTRWVLSLAVLFGVLSTLCWSDPPARGWSETGSYRGLIGLRTVYSDGSSTPEEYAAAAQRLGLDFLIFSDRAEQLTAEEWEKLKADCRKISNWRFKAIPGIEVRTKDYCGYFLNFDAYFDPSQFDGPKYDRNRWWSLFWKLWASHKAAGVLCRAETAPAPGGVSLVQGVEVFAAGPQGKVVDNLAIWKTYSRIKMPMSVIASARITSADQLAGARYFTCVWASSLHGIAEAFNEQAGAATYVSSGPEIRRFHVRGPALIPNNYWPRAGWFWSIFQRPLTFSLDVQSDHPLRSIALHTSRGVLWKTDRPEGLTMPLEVTLPFIECGQFWYEVTDQAGRQAVTSPITINGLEGMSTEACTDRRNIYFFDNASSVYSPAHRLMDVANEQFLTYMNQIHSSFSESVTTSEVSIQTIRHVEAGVGGFGVVAQTVDGEQATQKQYAGAIYNSQIVSIGYGRAGSDFAECESYWYLPRPFTFRGYLAVLVEKRIRFTKDLTLSDNHDVPLRLYAGATTEESLRQGYPYKQYTLDKGGKKQTQPLAPGELFSNVPFTQGDAMIVWDNPKVAHAYIPLDDHEYRLSASVVHGGLVSVHIGLGLKGKTIKAGQELTSRMLLLVSDPGSAQSDTFVEEFRSALIRPGYVMNLQVGTLLQTGYPAVIKADGNVARGTLGYPVRKRLPAPVFVEVRGLDCQAIILKYRNRETILPVMDGRCWLTMENVRFGASAPFSIRPCDVVKKTPTP
jgi:hypothetical protein